MNLQSTLQTSFPLVRRRRAVKHGLHFLFFAPLVGNLIIGLVISVTKANSLLEFAQGLIGVPLFGLIFAHIIAGVPAYLSGLILFNLDCHRSVRLKIAPLVGFLTMLLWVLAWAIVFSSTDILPIGLALSALAGVVATILVAYKQR